MVFGVLSIITLAAYWNSFKVPLVFDDLLTIQRNADVRFGNFYYSGSRALLFALFSLNYLWTGQEVWSYHLVNFLLHLVNGFLLFMLAERTFMRAIPLLAEEECRDRQRPGAPGWSVPRTYAALASAFFLVHPVQTESVTYISSRSELLSTSFYLAGMLIFVLWPDRKIGFLCSLAVGVAYFFGIGSKETVVTLPASIFLYDFIFVSRAEFRAMLSRWRFYLTFVLGAVAASYLIVRKLAGSIGPNLVGHLTIRQYFLTQLRVLVIYVRLVFLPIGLNLDYDIRPSNSPFAPAVIAAFLFLISLAVLGWMIRRRQPVFAFSIFWFFLTLSPTSSFVVIADVIFEHRLYLPMIGISLSFPLFIDLIYRKLKERIAIPSNALAYSGLIVIALIVGTIFRNYIWSDETRLWADVISKSPHKERPYNALAFALYKQAEYERAIEVLQKGSAEVPDEAADFSDTLGNLYLKTGQFQKAAELFNNTIPAFSGGRKALAYNNLGTAYLYMWNDLQAHRAQLAPGEFSARAEEILKPAAEAYQKAVEINREFTAIDSYVNAMCYRGLGDEVETTTLEKLKLKEDFEDLYILGKVSFNAAQDAQHRGDVKQAIADYQKTDQYFERAEKLNSTEKLVFFNHGYTLNALQQTDRAIEKYLQAIRLDPIFIEAQHNLGQIYLRKNDLAKAANAFAEVLRLDPKHVSSNLYLGYIYKAEGDKVRARSYLMTVLDAAPGNQQAVAMLHELDTASR
jgi:tetratricopeptide (TPR) repeat protein